MRPSSRATLALLGVVGLLCSACSLLPGGSEGDAPEPLTPLAPVAREVPEAPADRDDAEVQRALAVLDPCALLSPTAARKVGDDPGARMAHGPHSCVAGYGVRVTLHVGYDEWDRFDEERLALGGAVAYRNSPLLGNCKIYLPVSFTHAIEFGAPDTSRCRKPRAYAAAAARRLLGDPESLLRPAGPNRLAPCDLFAEAVAPVPDDQQLVTGWRDDQSLDECALWDLPDAEETGGLAINPVAARVHLELNLAPALDDWAGDGGYTRTFDTLAGERVQIQDEDGKGCWVHFDAWPADLPSSYGQTVQARVFGGRCERMQRVAAGLIRALRDGDAEPRPVDAEGLIYAADESDTPATGACQDVAGQADAECAPALDVGVPDDPRELLRRGEADPNVMCAAALGAVRERFGDDMRAATVLRSTATILDEDAPQVAECVFVEPSHALRVGVTASTESLGSLYLDGAELRIGGHAARRGEHGGLSEPKDSEVIAVALDGADEPGHLKVTVSVSPDREHGFWQSAPVDRKPLKSVEPFVTDLVEGLLG